MVSDRMVVEDLAKMSAWTQDSLGYARERGRRRLAWLLEAVRAEVELEGTLISLPSGEHLGSGRRPTRATATRDGVGTDDDPQRGKAEEKSRLRLAAWEAFMQGELRELELRRNGHLAELLAEALPGEAPELLRRLAQEDRRQAQDGLVALMSNGKLSYKSLQDLSEEDMPARIAASRARTSWLKERRDGWLRHGAGLRGEL